MRDYKTPAKSGDPSGARSPLARGRFRWLLAGIALPVLAVLMLFGFPDNTTPETAAVGEAEAADAVSSVATATPEAISQTAPAEIAVSPEPTAEDNGTFLKMTVGKGDTLDRMFRRNNLSIQDLHKIIALDIAKDHLAVVRPGDEFEVWHKEGAVEALHRELSIIDSVAITRSGDSFVGELYKNDVEYRQAEASGVIKDSLFLSAANAGISDRIIMNLTAIFAWDVDFVLDIREGDQFAVIYEEIWRDGKKVSEGEILAAEFINRGESFRALRYEGPDGRSSYYTPDGRNVRKAFLRAPLVFSRVSSNFNPKRLHPIRKTVRPHRGVDYAAPRGTPIKAAGDGKITFRGKKGGYGNVVILSHGGNISTLYAHMNGFKRGQKVGTRVRQGEIIGYVGSTGASTGPHLHYEYRLNGVHRNPRTVKLPQAEPIDPALKADFERATAALALRLDSQRQLLASNRKTSEDLR